MTTPALFPSLFLFQVVFLQTESMLIDSRTTFWVPAVCRALSLVLTDQSADPAVSDEPSASLSEEVALHTTECAFLKMWLRACARTHARTLPDHLGPAAPLPAPNSHLEHLPVHLGIGLHRVLREHESDESKALGFLGQAVDGEVQLRQGT